MKKAKKHKKQTSKTKLNKLDYVVNSVVLTTHAILASFLGGIPMLA